jgi:hypothetical protein
VVLGLEAELRPVPHLPQADVVLLGLAIGRFGIREVRKRGQQLVALIAQLGQLRLELLELGLQRARGVTQLLELRVVRLARLRGLLDLRRELVLLGADPVDARIQLPPPLIGRKELVELLGRTPSAQRGANGLGVAADLLEVERGSA